MFDLRGGGCIGAGLTWAKDQGSEAPGGLCITRVDGWMRLGTETSALVSPELWAMVFAELQISCEHLLKALVLGEAPAGSRSFRGEPAMPTGCFAPASGPQMLISRGTRAQVYPQAHQAPAPAPANLGLIPPGSFVALEGPSPSHLSSQRKGRTSVNTNAFLISF